MMELNQLHYVKVPLLGPHIKIVLKPWSTTAEDDLNLCHCPCGIFVQVCSHGYRGEVFEGFECSRMQQRNKVKKK